MAWFRCSCGHLAEVIRATATRSRRSTTCTPVPGSPAGTGLCVWRRLQRRPPLPRLNLRSPARPVAAWYEV